MPKRPIAILALALTLVCGVARAEDPALAEADRSAIRQTIEQQLAAFRHDDWPAAFSYAAPGIQAQFINPEIFGEMVRTGYAPVYRPREVEFRELVDTPQGPVQEVMLVGPDGRPVLALYKMQRQPDGSWLIAGCILAIAPDKAA